MGKIFCLMGKSASGKDTIYKRLLEQADFPFSVIVPCTTRPMKSIVSISLNFILYMIRTSFHNAIDRPFLFMADAR